MNLVESEDYAECIRICIRKRKLHLKIKQLGYEFEDFVHEVLTRTFLTNKVQEDKYAYGTIADRQLIWTLYAITDKRQKERNNHDFTPVSRAKLTEDNNTTESKDYVEYILNLKTINFQEKQVMRYRYVDGLSLRQISKVLPISAERARVVEKSAITKLKRFFKKID